MGGVARERYERMRESVRALYDRNRQRGHAAWCGYDYDFVCPSMGTYPFQWFWDSCFHTVALSHIDPERARSEVRSLLKNQQPDGFVAHVTFWQREAFEEMLKTYSIAYRTPYLSDCIQPPVLAEAVLAASRGEGGRAFLDEMLPKVRRYYDWLDRVRDDGAVTDFVSLGLGQLRTGIFNVADLAIVAGLLVFLVVGAGRTREPSAE
jgi:glycogen debranching enzyme